MLFVVILLTGLLMLVGLQLARKASELGKY
jgi:hypothetical protein